MDNTNKLDKTQSEIQRELYLKNSKELTKEEKKLKKSFDEKMKYEIAEELGLTNKVAETGWRGLTAKETGQIGGIMAKKKKEIKMLPTLEEKTKV